MHFHTINLGMHIHIIILSLYIISHIYFQLRILVRI
jgi:hypothetical protein